MMTVNDEMFRLDIVISLNHFDSVYFCYFVQVGQLIRGVYLLSTICNAFFQHIAYNSHSLSKLKYFVYRS